jgi:hypothetical protein
VAAAQFNLTAEPCRAVLGWKGHRGWHATPTKQCCTVEITELAAVGYTMDGVTETSIDSTPQELLRVYCALLALLLSPLWVRVLLSCLFAACKTLRSKAAGWQQQRQAAKARHK